MPTVYTDYSKISLKNLKDIQANQYRSKDAKRDYDPELIEKAIQRKLEKNQRKVEKQYHRELLEFELEKDILRRFIKLALENKQHLRQSTLDSIAEDVQKAMCDFI